MLLRHQDAGRGSGSGCVRCWAAVERHQGMKRLLVRALSVIALAIASACAWLFLRPPEPVTVKVVNASHQRIQVVLLKHENGVRLTKDIAVGETRVVTFPTRGETSYSLKARFADGRTVAGGGGYAEAGYSFTDFITDSGVNSELKLGVY